MDKKELVVNITTEFSNVRSSYTIERRHFIVIMMLIKI